MTRDLTHGFVPTLDGEDLRRSDDAEQRLLHADGTPVDAGRYDDVVYVNAQEREPPDVDVTSLLLTIAEAHRPEGPAADVDAGFFHRTLSRWMGIAPEDDPTVARAPVWDYGFWKAELKCEGELAAHAAALVGGDSPARVTTWCAVVWHGERAAAESYRYWVACDELGFVKGSGWLTKPPRLLDDGDGQVDTSAFAAGEVEPGLLERLLSEPDT